MFKLTDKYFWNYFRLQSIITQYFSPDVGKINCNLTKQIKCIISFNTSMLFFRVLGFWVPAKVKISFSASEVEFPLLDSVLFSHHASVALSIDPGLFATPYIPNNPLKVKPLLMCQSVPCECVPSGCRAVCDLPVFFSLYDAFGWSTAAALVAVVPELEFSSSCSLPSSPDNEPPVHG